MRISAARRAMASTSSEHVFRERDVRFEGFERRGQRGAFVREPGRMAASQPHRGCLTRRPTPGISNRSICSAAKKVTRRARDAVRILARSRPARSRSAAVPTARA